MPRTFPKGPGRVLWATSAQLVPVGLARLVVIGRAHTARLRHTGTVVHMAGVKDASVIDLVAEDPGSAGYVLVMVEDRGWGSEPDQLEQLRTKISLYASWILDGELGSQYPETVGRPVRIQLDCIEPLDNETSAIIDFANLRLRQYGIAVFVNVRN